MVSHLLHSLNRDLSRGSLKIIASLTMINSLERDGLHEAVN